MDLIEVVNLVVMVLLGGFLTFLATLLIKQDKWSSRLKLILSFVLAAIFALATAWKAGDVLGLALAWDGMKADVLIAYFVTYWTAATIWYKVVFKDAVWANSLGTWPSKPE